MASIADHTEEIDGQPIFWRSAPEPGAGDLPPVLYVHGVPTSSDDWVPFLQRTGGLAPDLIGFGRSSKRGDLPFTMAGYDAFIERFLDHVGVAQVRLVVHDWGTVGLLWAQRRPASVERLVIINGVPLLPGLRWHRMARAWRSRALGEIVMGFTNRFTARHAVKPAFVNPGGPPPEFVDAMIDHFDQGTQRAILRLYRDSPESALAAAGTELADVDCPALVVWGEQDPYLPSRFADDYAGALGGPAHVVHLADAGHWPWLDRPDVVDLVADFLTDGDT